MFNARLLFRPFGHSSVASEPFFYPCLSSFAELIHIYTRDTCIDLIRNFPPINSERT
jgi:hypothetical protein